MGQGKLKNTSLWRNQKLIVALQMIVFIGIWRGGIATVYSQTRQSRELYHFLHSSTLPIPSELIDAIPAYLTSLMFLAIAWFITGHLFKNTHYTEQVRTGFAGPRQVIDLFAGFLVGGILITLRNIFLVHATPLDQMSSNLTKHLFAFPWLLIFLLTTLVCFIEEAAFRGYVFPVCATTYGRKAAYFIVAIAFGAFHMVDGVHDILDAILITLRGGFLFTAAYWWTRRIWLPLGLHIGVDFTGIFLFGDKWFGVTPLLPLNKDEYLGILLAKLLLPYVIPLAVAHIMYILAQRRDRYESAANASDSSIPPKNETESSV